MSEHAEGRPDFAGMSGEEQLLLEARREAVRLAHQLLTAPFAAETRTELRAYADGEAAAAAWAWRELQQLPSEVLRKRLEELTRDEHGGTEAEA